MPYKTHIEKICPVCGNKFETKNRRKKTCNRKCAGISTIPFHKEKTTEDIEKQSIAIKSKYETDPEYRGKVSLGLKKYYRDNPDKIMRGEQLSKLIAETTRGKYNKNPKSILELSSRTVRKIFKRMKIGCSLCNWSKGICDIHHINGRKIPDPDNHNNLCYICPNCHRLIHEGKIKNNQLISLQEMAIFSSWKEYYFG